MDDCTARFEEAKIFLAVDALWEYWKIPIKMKNRDKATFILHLTSIAKINMQFQIYSAPATLQSSL